MEIDGLARDEQRRVRFPHRFFFLRIRDPPRSPLFPYPPLFRSAPGRPSVAIHLVVMGVAMFALPLSIATGWERPPAGEEALWLVGLLAVSIGLPFFAIAANSPLLQAWFARTDHPAAQDPYFLYAASNVGS